MHDIPQTFYYPSHLLPSDTGYLVSSDKFLVSARKTCCTSNTQLYYAKRTLKYKYKNTTPNEKFLKIKDFQFEHKITHNTKNWLLRLRDSDSLCCYLVLSYDLVAEH